ncbi:GNAT family N-acetyltransferase [Cohaesibacter gelatinilyticus]|mgnify:CR=1 FL=1|uniref:Ribosomal protein S18 acetylase RimI n=1 Tax=Cohaesibacter gelatinilyticus TaxID=372072 RepID=A0A285N893_9HYPH|nr:GNAT family N-acetyltransferase [Cohaesibacter gelatinilyticus]SNZ05639.1 Ribosomal protein S18 acetylase RimI [Cohaesibacter gelatinilyticus]HAT87788.1 GNAT family N-acetyltransferase [Hyphomicrobiales bacterium]
MTIINLRVANPDDAKAISRLKVLCWRDSYKGLMPDPALDNLDAKAEEPHWREWLSDEKSGLCAYVLHEGQNLIGYALAGPFRSLEKSDDEVEPMPDLADSEIYAIYLHPNHQRQGHGKMLVSALTKDLIDHGYKDVALWVVGGNMKAESFYERIGGQEGPKRVERRSNKIVFREKAYIWPDLRALHAKLTVKPV